MVLWLLVFGTFAFDPNAEVYKIFTIDTFRNAYEYPFEPWVMEDFVAKMNQKCAEQNLGFQYEIIQDENPPVWSAPDITTYMMNTEKYDAVITNPLGPLMQFGVIPFYSNANSKVPVIACSIGNSNAHYPIPPRNMFFPTPAVTFAYDDLVPMFLAQGFKKHTIVTQECDKIGFIAPLLVAKMNAWYGEENYICVNPKNETCAAPFENGGIPLPHPEHCLRPYAEVVEEIGDTDVVEFFEYYDFIYLVNYMHEKKLDYKAKVFFSQLPFKDEDLEVAMYGVVEQRGFSEDAAYHQNYDDGKNHLGIFSPKGNKTSQRVFNDWFDSHNSSALKLSVIGEIIGWNYLHENILRARKAQSTDLSATMRNGIFFPSIMGLVGTGPSQINDRVSKPLWMQVLPDMENNKKPKRNVMYPLEIAHVFSYHEMVKYDDRDCYPDCPECYDSICTQMATLLFISMAGLCGIMALVVMVSLCAVTRRDRMKTIAVIWVPLYAIFEVIACVAAVTSIHSIRKSKDTQHPLINWSLTVISCFDGLTGTVRLGNWISSMLLGIPLTSKTAFYWLEVVDSFLIFIGSGVYFIYIVQSTVETKSSAPQIVDITLNLIEVMLFVFGSAMVETLTSARKIFKSDDSEDTDVNSDSTGNP